jgi:hypothetical protein
MIFDFINFQPCFLLVHVKIVKYYKDCPIISNKHTLKLYYN